MPFIPLHPKIVHLPMALSVLLPLLSAGLLLSWIRGWLPRRTWFVAAALQAVLVLGAAAALRTGGQDEDRVEAVAGEAAIESHEQAAQQFTAVAAVVLVLAAGAALWPKEGVARGLALATVLGSLAVLAMGVRVGERGGRLVYGAPLAGGAGEKGAQAVSAGTGAAPGAAEPRETRGGEADDD
jgi:hypothetical protein